MPKIDGGIFDTETGINDGNIDEAIEWWLKEAHNERLA